jgi:hypothetical protein
MARRPCPAPTLEPLFSAFCIDARPHYVTKGIYQFCLDILFNGHFQQVPACQNNLGLHSLVDIPALSPSPSDFWNSGLEIEVLTVLGCNHPVSVPAHMGKCKQSPALLVRPAQTSYLVPRASVTSFPVSLDPYAVLPVCCTRIPEFKFPQAAVC